MDINNAAARTRIREHWQVRFLQAFTQGAVPAAEQICQMEQSSAAIEVYDLLIAVPMFQKVKDQIKKQNLARAQHRVTNEEYAATIAVKQADLERDSYGQYNNKFDVLGQAARRNPDRLLAYLMANAFTETDYTGTAFYAADKPHLPGVLDAGTFTNKMTAKPSANSWDAAKQLMGNIKDANGQPMGLGGKKTVVCSTKWVSTFRRILNAELIAQDIVGSGVAAVSNIYKGDADIIEFPWLNTTADQDKWFVLDTSWNLRSFILQNEVAPRFYSQDNPNVHKDAFDEHVFLYQGYYRGNVGLGLPQLSIASDGSTNAL